MNDQEQTTEVTPRVKLNPEFKQKWIDALRSGTYTQGRFSLKREREKGIFEHCCLGVACEIMGIPVDVSQYESYLALRLHIPSDIQDRCIRWNDDFSLGFSGIAKKVEETF